VGRNCRERETAPAFLRLASACVGPPLQRDGAVPGTPIPGCSGNSVTRGSPRYGRGTEAAEPLGEDEATGTAVAHLAREAIDPTTGEVLDGEVLPSNSLTVEEWAARITEPAGTPSVVAAHDRSDPALAIAGDGRHLALAATLAQQPDDLQVGTLDRLPGRPLALAHRSRRDRSPCSGEQPRPGLTSRQSTPSRHFLHASTGFGISRLRGRS
jgi:hypothetical protein